MSGDSLCGVSGILHKNQFSQDGLAPVGDELVRMLEPLTHRGKDSSGITVVGERLEGDLVVRIWTDDAAGAPDVLARAEETVRRSGGVVQSKRQTGPVPSAGDQLRRRGAQLGAGPA